uniref:GTP cyclohydrolase 1 feedback regulatory protein n=1 Tax=Myxine glutinosa TaxID=7769 RepID=UPI00358F556C
MPYVLLSTQIRTETGPTVVGDEASDPELMDYLGATKIQALGNNFYEYRVSDPPRIVLDHLDRRGFCLKQMAGVGQTVIWCMYKPPENEGPTVASSTDSSASKVLNQ